jgi:hypothetical protein
VLHAKKEVGKKRACGNGAKNPQKNACRGQAQSLANHQPKNVAGTRAQGGANPNFPGTSCDFESEQHVESDAGQGQSEKAKDGGERGNEAVGVKGFIEAGAKSFHAGDSDRRIEGVDDVADGTVQCADGHIRTNFEVAMRAGKVEELERAFAQIVVLGVGDYADDFQGTIIAAFDEAKMLTDRIAVAEKTASHGAVDDGHIGSLIGQ